MRAVEGAERETNRSQRKCTLRHSGVEDGEGGWGVSRGSVKTYVLLRDIFTAGCSPNLP